jgi:hypothetical protein
MTFSNTNLEKLIQMATIEQMYNILQNMRKDNNDISHVQFESNSMHNHNNDNVNSLHILSRLNLLDDNIKDIHFKSNEYFVQLNKVADLFESKMSQMATFIEIIGNKIDKLYEQTTLNKNLILEGQRKITDYFSNNEEHIRLQINEVVPVSIMESVSVPVPVPAPVPEAFKQDLLEHVNVVESDSESESEVATEDEEEQGVEEQKVEEEDEEQEEVEEEQEEVDEEEEEEKEEEEVEEEQEEVDEEEEEEKEDEEQEDEEEEEVFEIEIDDTTYYATSEENGILYEVTKDGEVGKKVGIIKDGEPIFE